jgi:hypothetical protein
MKQARNALALAERHEDAGPIMSDMILGAIAYIDVLTSAIAGTINQKDHKAAIQLLRNTLGKALPKAQVTNLHNLISSKDEVQYGASFERFQDAETMMSRVEAFQAWAEEELRRRFAVEMGTIDEGD